MVKRPRLHFYLLSVINTSQFFRPTSFQMSLDHDERAFQLSARTYSEECCVSFLQQWWYWCEWLYNGTENFCFRLQIPNLIAKRCDTYEMIHADGRRDASIALIS